MAILCKLGDSLRTVLPLQKLSFGNQLPLMISITCVKHMPHALLEKKKSQKKIEKVCNTTQQPDFQI